jgi:hypothetical protein
MKKDYATGVDILQRSWTELNDRSVIEDLNRGQSMFNAYVDISVEDPNEAWKWRGTRSMARNKGIAMHAQLTAGYLLPMFVAQNDNDEADRDMSEVMRDIVEWLADPMNSNYQSSFLQIVFGMETNPVTFLGAEYNEVYQKIKEKTDKGYEVKEVLDDVLSGFQAPIWSANQVLITNVYERNIQKQRVIIKRRYVEKAELEAKYGDHDNWGFVQDGVKSIYSEDDGLFYDIKDDDHPHLVAEETYLNRRDDTEICLINGIYFGESNIEHNPIKHRDNKGNPRYNITPFGFSRINDHFFYYKSMMNAMGWDNNLYDAMSEVVMNKALLETEMPMAYSGEGKIESDVIFPNSIVSMGKDDKLSPLMPNSNLAPAFQSLRETEDSMTDGSVSETMSGKLPQASQKAYSVAQAQAQAKKMIGAVGKSLAESVVQYGSLMKDIIINHITIPQVEELTGGIMKMKYKSFFLGDKKGKSGVSDKTIKFDESLIGKEMTDQDKKYEELKMLEESGYPDKKNSLIRVNPEMFAKFNYYCKVDIEEMFTKNQEYWQPVLLALRREMLNDPFIDMEKLDRKIFYEHFRSEGDEYIKEQNQTIPGIPNSVLGEQIQGRGSEMVGNYNKKTANAVNGQVL